MGEFAPHAPRGARGRGAIRGVGKAKGERWFLAAPRARACGLCGSPNLPERLLKLECASVAGNWGQRGAGHRGEGPRAFGRPPHAVSPPPTLATPQVPSKEVSLDPAAAIAAVLATSTAKYTETVEFHAR